MLLDRDYQVVSVLGENPRENELAKFKVPLKLGKRLSLSLRMAVALVRMGPFISKIGTNGGASPSFCLKNLTTTDVDALTDLDRMRRLPALWAPNQLDGLFLWLDAADVETFTISSGRVAQWDDKSGKGLHAYALDPESGRALENEL